VEKARKLKYLYGEFSDIANTKKAPGASLPWYSYGNKVRHLVPKGWQQSEIGSL
jgi:hypothetical protein